MLEVDRHLELQIILTGGVAATGLTGGCPAGTTRVGTSSSQNQPMVCIISMWKRTGVKDISTSQTMRRKNGVDVVVNRSDSSYRTMSSISEAERNSCKNKGKDRAWIS